MRHTTVRDMAKLVDAIREAREGGHAVFGFEYFRPSTEVGVEKLYVPYCVADSSV